MLLHHCVCPCDLNKHWKQRSFNLSAMEAFWWAAVSCSGFTHFSFFACFYPILSNFGAWGGGLLYECCSSILHSRSWNGCSRISLGRRSPIKWLVSGWGLPSGTWFGSLMKGQDFSLPSLGYTACVSADSLRDAGWVCRIRGFFLN